MSTPVKALAIVFIVSAVAAAAAGCAPLEWLRPLGEFVRRPDDVTPERHARYLHVCWFFAVAFASLGAFCLKRRPDVESFLTGLRRDVRGMRFVPHDCDAAFCFATLAVIVGTLLRLKRLDDPVAYDEAYTFLNFARRPWYVAIADYNSTNNHMLNTFLMHWCRRLWGQTEWVLRLPVFVSGVLLMPAVYLWASRLLGRPTAVVTTVLVAGSPLLITYSTDARGYMFVALFAIVMDDSFARLHADAARDGTERKRSPGDEPRPLLWLTAWTAMVLGLWAMPIMLFAVVAVCGWYLAAPLVAGDADRGVRLQGRFKQLLLFGGTGVVGVAALYSPAYIFRGLMFLDDPIMQSVALSDLPQQLVTGWSGALEWWTEGPVHWTLWLAAIAVGAWMLLGDRVLRLRILAPFAAVLAINVVQRATGAPRVYLLLSPWVYLLAAHGPTSLLNRTPKTVKFATAMVILTVFARHAVVRPVLIDPADRGGYASVPDAVARIGRESRSRPHAKLRLIAPLPCDLPALFYLEREGLPIPVNGTPQPGETVWLIARRGRSPEFTLKTKLVGLGDMVEQFDSWKRVEKFETLTLYVAEFQPALQDVGR